MADINEATFRIALTALKAARMAMMILDELEGQFDRIAPPRAPTRPRLRLLP
jgi:hypothetical protein